MGFSDAVAAGPGARRRPLRAGGAAGPLRRARGLAGLDYPDSAPGSSPVCDRHPGAELSAIVARPTPFDRPEIAPLLGLSPEIHVLELFHGPTLAFKDVALQLLGNLYARQCRCGARRSTSWAPPPATPGPRPSTASWAKPGVAIFILYPDGRVSPLQERQMACTGAANVHALAVDGSFDDAQAVLKETLRRRGPSGTAPALGGQLDQHRPHPGPVRLLPARLAAPARRSSGRRNSSCRPATSGTSSPGWMLQKMGVPIRGFRWRRTRTTSSTGSSRPGSTGWAR
jgi:threonine synthase